MVRHYVISCCKYLTNRTKALRTKRFIEIDSFVLFSLLLRWIEGGGSLKIDLKRILTDFLLRFFVSEAEPDRGHQSHHQEELGQVAKPPRKRNQNPEGESFANEAVAFSRNLNCNFVPKISYLKCPSIHRYQ